MDLLSRAYGARPLVRHMCEHMESAALGETHVLMDLYDVRTNAAIARLRGEVPAEMAGDIDDLVLNGSRAAARHWAALIDPPSAATARRHADEDPEVDDVAMRVMAVRAVAACVSPTRRVPDSCVEVRLRCTVYHVP